MNSVNRIKRALFIGLLTASVSCTTLAGPLLYTPHAFAVGTPQCDFIWHGGDNPTGG